MDSFLNDYGLFIVYPFSSALTVNFNPVSYMVDEGDSTQLIVELSSPADRDVAVDVTLNSGTAIGEDLNKFNV